MGSKVGRQCAFGQVLTQKLVQGLSVTWACRYMGHSRQAYYQGRHRERKRQQQAWRVVSMVTALRVRQPKLGTRKLHHMLGQPLQEARIKGGRDALFDILVRQAGRKKPRLAASPV